MPVNTYACYETGHRMCSIPRLVDICEVLGLTVGELFNRVAAILAGEEPAGSEPDVVERLNGLAAGQAEILGLLRTLATVTP